MNSMRDIKKFLVKNYFGLSLILVFIVGFGTHGIVDTLEAQPLTIQAVTGQVIAAPERASPGDYLTEEDIKVYQDRIVIEIEDAIWASFEATKSMDPTLDHTAHGIEIVPESCDEIVIGDIISYQTDDTAIIHRVVGQGYDELGKYFVLKGDNNPVNDPERVRCEQVKRKLIGILY